jgi:hypothetical protein
MPIRPFLEGRVFDPDRARVIGIVFDRVCGKLGLAGAKDFLARIVARAVIDAAGSDSRDPDLLTAQVIQQFRLPDTLEKPSASGRQETG